MGNFSRILIIAVCCMTMFAVPCSSAEKSSPSGYHQEGEDFLIPDVALYEMMVEEYSQETTSIRISQSIVGPGKTLEPHDPDMMEPDSGPFLNEIEEMDLIADPFEIVNRFFFHFNDKLYFWFLKPIGTGYGKVVPEPLRVSVRNFFSNLAMPIRAVNCILQGKFKGFGIEITRFVVNSTVGVAGFGDPAKQVYNLDPQDEDLGQTLGSYGLGPAFYITWPVLGPSSLRDTIGMAGDTFLNPLTYGIENIGYNFAVRGYDQVNRTSLKIGDYESLKKSALDPYVSLRDAYHQYRKSKIKK